MKTDMTLFEEYQIRRIYDEKGEIWWFSVIDIIRVLTQQEDYQTARKYWNKLKQRLKKEGNQSVTNCHRLKLAAADGKKYFTDVATAETLLRLVQSVPIWRNCPPGRLLRAGTRQDSTRISMRPKQAVISPEKPARNWKRKPTARW